MELTISIVSYNTKDLLKRCIDSIKKNTTNLTYEIIVVDNASSDGSVEMIQNNYNDVILIKNKSNIFFTKANNQAFKKSKGKLFLILNSDTYFVDNSIKKMASFLNEKKNIAACQPLEKDEEGRIMKNGSRFSSPRIDFYELSLLGRLFRNNDVVNRYRLSDQSRKELFKVEVACDSCLMIKSKIFRKLGGYDERFLLYYTENDLCKRIVNLGYTIMHYPKATVMHRVSASAKQLGWKKNDIYYIDLLTYYKKHDSKVLANMLFFVLKIEKILLLLRQKLNRRLNLVP